MTPYAQAKIEKEIQERTGVLDLQNCDLEAIPDEILQLDWLNVLILSNVIDENEVLKKILADLNLTGLVRFIPDINAKHPLRASRPNTISELSPVLNKLTNLVVLLCGGYRLSGKFPISKIQNIEKLKQLKYLDLSCCLISEIEGISDLKELEYLNLTSNKIKTIYGLEKLSKLKLLALEDNLISKIERLKLSNLEKLYLSGNKIEEIEGLDNLKSLVKLDLIGNQLAKIDNLNSLASLTDLFLSSNQITEIENLKQLTLLERLNLHSNAISKIENLQELVNLKELDLYSNKIEKYENLDSLQKLESLVLRDNPIKNLDPSIIFDYNCLSNLKTWNQELSSSVPNSSYKICLLGDTRVGKSSLLDRLKYNRFDPYKESSHAIILDSMKITYNDLKIDGDKDLTIEFFDFGGQDIYHGTHRWFLKSRHLNLLLYNEDTKDTQDNERKDLEYWIRLCRKHNADNPILLVQSKTYSQGKIEPPEYERLKTEYPNLINEIVHIDSALDDSNGFDQLKRLLGEGLQRVLGFGMIIPTSFALARQALNAMAELEKEIDYEDLKNFAKNTWGVGKYYDFDACFSLLLKWLQSTGTLFYNKNLLNGRIILDQKWAIKAIYSLFEPDSLIVKRLKANHGRISVAEVYSQFIDYSTYEKDLLLNYLKSSYAVFEPVYNFYHDQNERNLIVTKYLPFTTLYKREGRPQCNYTRKIHGFSHLDFMDLITVLSNRLNYRIEALSQEMITFDYLHFCNGQISFNARTSELFMSLMENESVSIDYEIKRGIEILGFTYEQTNNPQAPTPIIVSKPRINVFVSYPHQYKDASTLFISKLETFLKTHKKYEIKIWSDEKIFMSTDWHEKIQKEIKNSDMSIMLLCQNFFTSEYIRQHELKEFLEKNKEIDYPIVPVNLAPYVYEDHEEILKRQAFVPDVNKFINSYPQDFCFTHLVYKRSEYNPQAGSSPDVDSYFRQFRARLEDIFEGIKK